LVQNSLPSLATPVGTNWRLAATPTRTSSPHRVGGSTRLPGRSRLRSRAHQRSTMSTRR
jgi:hypothetical protein